MIPGGSHMLPYEDATTLAEVVSRFLG